MLNHPRDEAVITTIAFVRHCKQKILYIEIEISSVIEWWRKQTGTATQHSIHLLLKRLRCEWTNQYIDPPPQTFEDAIEVYKSLPGKSLEDERVVSFSIAPLSDYCGVIDEILNSISDQNIEFVTNMLVDFEAVDKVLRRLKSTKLASDFLTYRSILLDLERRFELQRSQFIYRIQCRVD